MARSRKLEIARLLATRGLHLFPLRPGGKLPAIKGWQELATGESLPLKRWFGEGDANIGVATGPSRLIVIDTDQKEGRDGDANLRAMAGEHVADLDATFTVQSPTGSRHYYFRGEPVRNSVSKLADAVDIRSDGGLVVAPGSTTAKGTYHVINKAEIAAAPQWLLGAIADAYVQSEKVKLDTPVDLDNAAAIGLAQRYLDEDAEPSIEGRGGNDNAYRVACRLKDFGVSDFMAVTLMGGGSWNGRCEPPWDDDELQEIVDHAWRYGENSPGSSSIELEFDVLPDEDEEEIALAPKKGKLHYIKWEDVAIDTASTFLIENWMDQGSMIVTYGDSNVGKTNVVLSQAYAIAAGQPWGEADVQQGLVVYVAAEGGRGLKKRVVAYHKSRGRGDHLPLAVVPCPVDLMRPKGDTKELIELIRAAEADYGQRCVMVVIDTLSRALAGGNENAPDDMGAFVMHADRIRMATRAAVHVIHHSGKNQAAGARGHSSLRAATDTEIEITPGIIAGTKQRDMETPAPYSFSLETVAIGVDRRGKPITSVVCSVAKADPRQLKLKDLPKGYPAVMMAMFRELSADSPEGVEVEAWRAAALPAMRAAARAGTTDGSLHDAFTNRLNKILVAGGHVRRINRDGHDWYVDTPKSDDPID